MGMRRYFLCFLSALVGYGYGQQIVLSDEQFANNGAFSPRVRRLRREEKDPQRLFVVSQGEDNPESQQLEEVHPELEEIHPESPTQKKGRVYSFSDTNSSFSQLGRLGIARPDAIKQDIYRSQYWVPLWTNSKGDAKWHHDDGMTSRRLLEDDDGASQSRTLLKNMILSAQKENGKIRLRFV